MKQSVYLLLLLTIGGIAATGWAQSGAARRFNQPYATDYFEGFSVLDEKKKIPQKEPSFWFDLTYHTPKEQLDYARVKDEAGETRRARHAYEALVREWPESDEACKGQLALARMLERNGKLSKAFDEYQYLLAYYAGQCPFYEVLDCQFKIANSLLATERNMFGWRLDGSVEQRERFETIVRNAPRSPMVPEMLLIIGSIRLSANELKEAISVYDGLLNRFPESKQAVPAAYLDAKSRYLLTMKNRSNEDRCRNSVAFFRALLERMPNHPEKKELIGWQKELTDLLIEQNYRAAVFYDTKQRNAVAAKTAYQKFLKEFPDSKYAEDVKKRLEALEQGAAPLRR